MSGLAELAEEIERTVEGKDKLIEILAKAVKLGMDALPDSEAYGYCWEECLSEEQEKVKMVRKQLGEALEIYRAVKNASKGENDE